MVSNWSKNPNYPPGNEHIPSITTFEDDCPFPTMGYVSSLEGNITSSGTFLLATYTILTHGQHEHHPRIPIQPLPLLEAIRCPPWVDENPTGMSEFSPKFGGLVRGNLLLTSGKSRLVKDYNLARFNENKWPTYCWWFRNPANTSCGW